MIHAKDCNFEGGEYALGPLFFRPVHLPKIGDVIDGHTHNFDHVSFVMKGSIKVHTKAPDGTEEDAEFGQGMKFLTRKEVEHEIVALEDNTVMDCVFTHRNMEGEVVQEDSLENSPEQHG